jgi:NtrC-family two-component system sensor histidine kinase KinB
MSLRLKLILGFAIPALMLIVVGIWSSYQMRTLGTQVRDMLDMNERSIRASVQMNEALERIDSGVLLRFHGDEESFLRIFNTAKPEYEQALLAAVNNVTVPGEGELLDTLQTVSKQYFQILAQVGDSQDLKVYWEQVYPVFSCAQKLNSNLRLMNSEQMYKTAQSVTDQASRAALPGDLIILAAVIFFLLFTWLTQLYIVKPLRLLIDAVQLWKSKGQFEPPEIESKDEIEQLVSELKAIYHRS